MRRDRCQWAPGVAARPRRRKRGLSRARSPYRGQASVEALALVPLMAAVVLLVWQLAVLVRGSLIAQEQVRAMALPAQGAGIVHVHGSVRVPALLPGVGVLRIPVRAVVYGP